MEKLLETLAARRDELVMMLKTLSEKLGRGSEREDITREEEIMRVSAKIDELDRTVLMIRSMM